MVDVILTKNPIKHEPHKPKWYKYTSAEYLASNLNSIVKSIRQCTSMYDWAVLGIKMKKALGMVPNNLGLNPDPTVDKKDHGAPILM